MKVATLVLFVAIAGLLVVGAVDAKRNGPIVRDPVAISFANAESVACGPNLAVAVGTTYTEAYSIPATCRTSGSAFAAACATSIAVAA